MQTNDQVQPDSTLLSFSAEEETKQTSQEKIENIKLTDDVSIDFEATQLPQSNSSSIQGNTTQDSQEEKKVLATAQLENVEQESISSQSTFLVEINLEDSVLIKKYISTEKDKLDDPLPTPQEVNEHFPQSSIAYNQYLSERAHHNLIWQIFQDIGELPNHRSTLRILQSFLDRSQITQINKKLQEISKSLATYSLTKKIFEILKEKNQNMTDDRNEFEIMTDGQILSIQNFHFCTNYLEEQGKQEKVSELKCPFKPEENRSLKRLKNLEKEEKFIELSGDKYEEYLGMKDGILTMIEDICKDQDDDSQIFADQIVNDLHSLENQEFYAYIYEAVCKVIEVLQITMYFTNLEKPNPNLPMVQPVSVPLIDPPKNIQLKNLDNSENLFDSVGNTPYFQQQPKPDEITLKPNNLNQNLNQQKNEEELKLQEPFPKPSLNNQQVEENPLIQNKMSLFTFVTEKNYQEQVEKAIMKTQLSKKYGRKSMNILEELEDEPDIKTTNYDLEKLAQPFNISYLNELIVKLKEIACEIDLNLDNEAHFELTDSQIMALNLFFKLQNFLQEKPDLLSGLKCPVELPEVEPEKQTTFLEILTNKKYQQLIGLSINSANQKLERTLKRKYDRILEILEEEEEKDFDEINEILQKLAKPSQNNFINEIKEQIILNAQQQEIQFNIESLMVLTDSEIIALNMFFQVQDQLIDKPDFLALINCPIKIPEEQKPIPEEIVIDYWVRFQTLENEQIFIELSGQKCDDNKRRKNMIKKKIDGLIECLERDSDEGIQENQNQIKKQVERFDQNTEFLNYFKNELKNVAKQLNLQEQFKDIIDFSIESVLINPQPPVPQPEPPKPNNELKKLKILVPSDVKTNDYQQTFQYDLMTLDSGDLFQKHSILLKIFEYFDSLRIRNLIREKFPGCQELILKNYIQLILQKIGDYIELKAPENERERIVNEIDPLFVQIYEYENSQEFSSLADQPKIQIYEFIVSLVQTACPQITIQKPVSLHDQQIQQFQQLQEFLPSIGRQISIQEYGTLDENSNIRDQIKFLIEDYKINNKLDGEKLLKILFDLIKKRVDFRELLQPLSQINNKNNLTQLILLQYALEHSDPQLKVLLCITCAYFIPLPLLGFNPWQQNQQINKLQMIPEILYIYEKCKSLIQFKLSSNKKTFLQSSSLNGCTSLLNRLFGRQFSLHEQNLVNYGTVEMQLDLNCADVEHLVIADVHGFIDIQNLKQIFPLFDGFIIHVSEKNFQDQEIQSNLDLLFREIPTDLNSEKTLLIIKHDSQNQIFEPKQWQNINDRRLKVFEICTQNLQNLSDNNYQILIRSIHMALNNFFNLEVASYKSTPKIRLESKEVFLNVLEQVNSKEKIIKHQEAHDKLCEIINCIQNQENLKGTDFLPMLNYINRQSILQDIITSENIPQQAKTDARFDLRQIQNAMIDAQSTKISNLFSDIVFNHQCMQLLPSLSSIVKGFLESKLKVIIEERDQVKDQYLKTELENKNTRERLEEQIKNLNKAVDEKWFSTELLSRELFYQGQNSKKSQITKEDYYQLVRHFEQTAQPFELVDGDTLNFTTNVYQEVFQDYNNEDLLVVCVLGPQSSGKSLLMNYLFGTSFLSSSGRCTKGIYSSILRFKDKDGVYKRILILDTEGIQSSEARDTTFDKRIVYYAICVSHVVLMCNRGEMNAPMTETIKLVADAIVNTSMPFLKNPTIYIILNMLANPNDKTQLECIDELNRTLRELAAAASRQTNAENEVNSRQMVDQVLRINQDSLIPLGFAFNTFQFGSNIRRTVNQPSPEFAFRTMQLREQILSKFNEIKNSKSTKYSLKDWFNHAQNFWTFSRDCRTLKEYSSLGQKRIDDELMLEIERLMKDNYVDNWKSVLKIQIKSELQSIFDQFQGGTSIRFQILNNKISTKIAETYNLIQERVLEQYKIFCQDKAVASDLMEKRKQIVNRKKEFFEKQALQYCRVSLSKFQEKKSQLVGDTILHEETIRLLRLKESYTEKEANELFQKSWKKSIEQIEEGISNNDELITSSQKSVTDEFKYFLNHTPINSIDYFALARNESQDKWQQLLIKQYKRDGLMFNGDNIGPNIKAIIESQERQRKYTKDNQIKIFEDKTTYQYFKWWDALKSIIQINLLAKKITEKLLQQDRNVLRKAWDQLTSTEQQIRKEIKRELKEIIDKFKNENNKLGFSFSADEQTFITLYGSDSIDYYDLLRQSKNILANQKYFSCKEYIDPFKVSNRVNANLGKEAIARNLNLEYFTLYDSKWAYYKIENYTQESYSSLSIDQAFPINKETDIRILPNIKSFITNQIIERPENFYDYLEYLKNPHKQQAVSQNNQAGQEYFFNAIQWEIIFQDIELAIIKNYKVNGEIQVDYKIKDYIEILAKNDKQSEQLTSEFSKMTQKLARGIFRDVSEIIKKIDEEIEAFCMKISEQGKVFIFSVTQIFTSLLTEKLEIIRESYPLRQFKSRKQIEKNLFIAKLTQNDTQMDRSNAEKFAEQLCTFFYSECKERAVQLFQTNMGKKQNAFQKVYFVTEMEEKCVVMYDQQEADPSYNLTSEQAKVKDELVNYYMDPSNFLEGKFQEEFKKVSSEFLSSCKQQFSDSYEAKVSKILEYFVRLQKNLIEKRTDQYSTVLFWADICCQEQLKNEIQIGTANQQQLQKKAASQYLKQLLKDSWSTDSEIIFGPWKFLSQIDYLLPVSCEIQNPENRRFDPLIHDMMANYFEEKIEISHIYKFVETVAKFFNRNKTIEGYLKVQKESDSQEIDLDSIDNNGQFNQINSDNILDQSNISARRVEGEFSDESIEIINALQQNQTVERQIREKPEVIKDEILLGEFYQDYRNKFLGCKEVCPLCRKQCDQNHDENIIQDTLVHDCQLGHQLQGFGGSKTQDEDIAITISCNNLKDNDFVVYKGQDMKWLEIKNNKLKNWNFNKDQTQIDITRQTQIKLWNLIGPDICKRYHRECGYKIEWQRAEQNLPVEGNKLIKVHYIMMLDDSGSMAGQPWRDLKTSFGTFISLLMSNQVQLDNTKVSCIQYNTEALESFKDLAPDRSMMDLIKYRGGGTEFNPPLNMAYQLCSQFYQTNDKLVLYLLTDGGANMPMAAIKAFKEDKTFKNKIEFTAVGFGRDADLKILKKIADQMPNGKVSKALTVKELTESLKKIVLGDIDIRN